MTSHLVTLATDSHQTFCQNVSKGQDKLGNIVAETLL